MEKHVAIREIIDELGATWTVIAAAPTSVGNKIGVADAYQAGWLFFHRVGESRRSPGIPDRWESVDEGVLLGVLKTSVRSGQRTERP